MVKACSFGVLQYKVQVQMTNFMKKIAFEPNIYFCIA